MNVKERLISEEIVLQSFLMQPNHIAVVFHRTFRRIVDLKDANTLFFFLLFCSSRTLQNMYIALYNLPLLLMSLGQSSHKCSFPHD